MKNGTIISGGIAIVGLALGFVAGSDSMPPGPDTSLAAMRRSPRDQATATHSSPVERHDYRSLKKWMDGGGGLWESHIAMLERMCATDIRLILEESSSITDASLNLAVAELLHREGLAAFDWAERIEDKDQREAILGTLIAEACGTTPTVALHWLSRKSQDLGPFRINSFLVRAIQSIPTHGVDSLRLIQYFSEAGRGDDLSAVAPDCDFAGLIEAMPEFKRMDILLQGWGRQDPDAAFRAVMEQKQNTGLSKKGEYLAMIFSGMSRTASQKDSARWLARKLDELPDGERATAVEHCAYEMSGIPMLKALTEEMERPEERKVLMRQAAIFEEALPLELVKAWGDEAEQTAGLKNYFDIWISGDPEIINSMSYEELLDLLRSAEKLEE